MFLAVAWAGCADPPPALEIDCALAPDNALRVVCEAASDVDVDVMLEAAGEAPTSATGRGTVALWRLLPDTRYAWTARAGEAEATGEVTTGALPREAHLIVQQQGLSPVDDVMFLVDCGESGAQRPTAVAVDPEGRVVWYQELAADLPRGNHPIVGLTWSEDGTVLAALDRDRVREYALDGALLMDHVVSDRVVHHDVFRRDGVTYAITAHLQELDHGDYIVDGVDAWTSDGERVFRWDLSQVAEPSGPGGIGVLYWGQRWPGAADWAHANGIFVAEDGDFVLSMHSFSTVARFEGDPGDAAFGTPVWIADGSGQAPWPSTFAMDDPFGGQHHPVLLADDVLQVYDNRAVATGTSRGLRLRLDEGAGIAEVIGSWPVAPGCPIEGALYELSDGNLVATCALRTTFYHLEFDTAELLGTTTATCAAGAADLALLPRAIPVDLRSTRGAVP